MSLQIKSYGKKGYYGIWTTISEGWRKKGFTYDEVIHEFFDTEILTLEHKLDKMKIYKQKWLSDNPRPDKQPRDSRKFVGVNHYGEAVWEIKEKESV